jgi:hypothetical protein
MNSHSINLINFKNPTDIFNYCEKHNINSLIEGDSEIWCKLIEKNYNKYTNFKTKPITYKDYYVLLYFIQCLNLLTDSFIITKTQEVISIIPSIYEGDHIAIIHGCNNLAVRNNKAKLLMYRNKDEQCPLPTYGSGFLKINFINSNTDIFSNNINVAQYKPPFNSSLYYGGYTIL